MSASWVIKNRVTGQVLFETFNRAMVDGLDLEKFIAVPIKEYLYGLNNDSKRHPEPGNANTNQTVLTQQRDGNASSFYLT